MGGLRVKAKGEPVGFHLDTLKEGNVFLQARWLKCFELFCSVGFLAKGFCTCVSFAPASKVDLVFLQIEGRPLLPTLM
jgi:hypothetical protein